MRSISLLLLVLCFSIAGYGQQKPTKEIEFNYLDISGNVVRTTHAAKYRIYVDRSFKFLGVLNHQASYNDIGFNVSMAVFARGKDLILIHAERHTDGSGGLDYSDLEPSKLSGLPFTHRTQCASPEDKEELDSNPQIQFVRSKGFDLSIPFQLEQFFTTSRDGTSEIVISYGRAVQTCTEQIGAGLIKELQNVVKLTEIELDPDSNAYYVKVAIPVGGDCENKVGDKGLETTADHCSFGPALEPGTKVLITKSAVGKRWEKLVISPADGGEKSVLMLKKADKEAFTGLFELFFTKRFFDEVTPAPNCNGLETQLDILRVLGFPSFLERKGPRERWSYGLDRPFGCNDFTYFLLEHGRVLSIEMTV